MMINISSGSTLRITYMYMFLYRTFFWEFVGFFFHRR